MLNLEFSFNALHVTLPRDLFGPLCLRRAPTTKKLLRQTTCDVQSLRCTPTARRQLSSLVHSRTMAKRRAASLSPAEVSDDNITVAPRRNVRCKTTTSAPVGTTSRTVDHVLVPTGEGPSQHELSKPYLERSLTVNYTRRGTQTSQGAVGTADHAGEDPLQASPAPPADASDSSYAELDVHRPPQTRGARTSLSRQVKSQRHVATPTAALDTPLIINRKLSPQDASIACTSSE